MSTKDIHENHEPAPPLGLGSSEGLGPAPPTCERCDFLLAAAREAQHLGGHYAQQVIDQRAEIERLREAAAETVSARAVIEQCRAALAEELSAWDIDPPLHHVKEAHDACVAWLAGHNVRDKLPDTAARSNDDNEQ